MPGVTHKDILLAMRPLVVDGLNEIGSLAVKESTNVNPVLGAVTSAVIDVLFTEEHVNVVLGKLHDGLVRLFGDDYPTLVNADKIVWEDDR